ncbi:DUF7662 domain-containing protein [Paenibacillus flagellatus]|uniref:DUF7662 domain-containing protein n=1 Tax=Paenibacillus flagellatus TaxID=2211139 RepID=A0A2V5KA86_9BACL|nr:hypothetical protein [Paenibacillus flagellatus]PYI56348.1 hypothetical protein DLM86_05045 [Paenibacillus flagellatus]
MNDYKPLGRYLFGQSKQTVTLTFEEVERILGFKLPPSATMQPHWWSNTILDSSSQSIAWLKAFWRVSRVELGQRKRVTFVRSEIA